MTICDFFTGFMFPRSGCGIGNNSFWRSFRGGGFQSFLTAVVIEIVISLVRGTMSSFVRPSYVNR